MTLRAHADGPEETRALEAWRVIWTSPLWPTKTEGELHTLQAGLCYMCTEPYRLDLRDKGVWAADWHERGVSKDHVFPRRVGGQRSVNVLLACRRCNNVVKDARWPRPCELIYLAAIYAPPYDAPAVRIARRAALEARNARRRAWMDARQV